VTTRRYGGGRLAKGATQTAHKRARSPNMPAGRWIRPERRLAIYMRDQFRCLLCGVDLLQASPRSISLDHWRPRARGGTNESSNLFAACHACNSKRGDGPLPRGRLRCVRACTTSPLGNHLDTAKTILGILSADWAEAVGIAQKFMIRGVK
jgi:hypothetical protein